MKRKHDPKGAVCGLALAVCLGAWALDNTIDNDYWNTTGYVNTSPVEQTSGALEAAFAAPSAVSVVGGACGGAFDSRWFSCLGADLPSAFRAVRPWLCLFIK